MDGLSAMYREAVLSLVNALKIDEGNADDGVPKDDTKDAQMYREANEKLRGFLREAEVSSEQRS